MILLGVAAEALGSMKKEKCLLAFGGGTETVKRLLIGCGKLIRSAAENLCRGMLGI